MSEYKMPSLGADMEDAILLAWRVKEGDRVHKGDIIAEIETVKGDIDVEVFEDGIIEAIHAQPGQKLPVGTVMAYINTEAPGASRAAGSDEPDPPEEVPPKEKPDKEEPPVEIPPVSDPPEAEPPMEIPPLEKDPVRKPPPPEIQPHKEPTIKPPPPEFTFPNQQGGNERRIKASPLARSMANEMGLDLTKVESNSMTGVIHKSDIEKYLQTKNKTPATASRAIPQKSAKENMRSAIAAAMSRSNRDIPHYYLESSIDMKAALDWLEAENRKLSVKDRLLPVVLLLKATALALKKVPALNGYWKDDRFESREAINIGFTISLRGGGLVIPAIQQVDQKSLQVLMSELSDMIQRARTAKLRSSELTSGTITITNLGEQGAEKVFGIVYPPQVALVGFGKMIQKPTVRDGMIGIHPSMSITLSADHRASDGLTGSRFLHTLDRLLQEPEQLRN